jgi:hypothetical protein
MATKHPLYGVLEELRGNMQLRRLTQLRARALEVFVMCPATSGHHHVLAECGG